MSSERKRHRPGRVTPAVDMYIVYILFYVYKCTSMIIIACYMCSIIRDDSMIRTMQFCFVHIYTLYYMNGAVNIFGFYCKRKSREKGYYIYNIVLFSGDK